MVTVQVSFHTWDGTCSNTCTGTHIVQVPHWYQGWYSTVQYWHPSTHTVFGIHTIPVLYQCSHCPCCTCTLMIPYQGLYWYQYWYLFRYLYHIGTCSSSHLGQYPYQSQYCTLTEARKYGLGSMETGTVQVPVSYW